MANIGVIVYLVLVTFQQSFASRQGVYFSAHTNRHYTNKELREEAVVKFQDVVVNQGHGYDPATGAFTAPFDGDYRFDWSYLINRDGSLWLCLEINGACTVKIVGQPVPKHYATVSKSVIVHLKAGDAVRLGFFVADIKVGSIYGAEGRYTSFSGQLLD